MLTKRVLSSAWEETLRKTLKTNVNILIEEGSEVFTVPNSKNSTSSFTMHIGMGDKNKIFGDEYDVETVQSVLFYHEYGHLLFQSFNFIEFLKTEYPTVKCTEKVMKDFVQVYDDLFIDSYWSNLFPLYRKKMVEELNALVVPKYDDIVKFVENLDKKNFWAVLLFCGYDYSLIPRNKSLRSYLEKHLPNRVDVIDELYSLIPYYDSNITYSSTREFFWVRGCYYNRTIDYYNKLPDPPVENNSSSDKNSGKSKGQKGGNGAAGTGGKDTDDNEKEENSTNGEGGEENGDIEDAEIDDGDGFKYDKDGELKLEADFTNEELIEALKNISPGSFDMENYLNFKFVKNGVRFLKDVKKALEEGKRASGRILSNSGTGSINTKKYISGKISGKYVNTFTKKTLNGYEGSKWLFIVDDSGSTLNFGKERVSSVIDSEIELVQSFLDALPLSIHADVVKFSTNFTLIKNVNRKNFVDKFTKKMNFGGTTWSYELIELMTRYAKDNYQVVIITDGEISIGGSASNYFLSHYKSFRFKPIIFLFNEYESSIVAKLHLKNGEDYANISLDTSTLDGNTLKYIRGIATNMR